MMNAGDIAFPHLGIYLENVPRSFSVFGFEIAFYGLIIGIGVLAGILMAVHQAKVTGENPDTIWDFAIYAVIFSVIGARIYYVVFAWRYGDLRRCDRSIPDTAHLLQDQEDQPVPAGRSVCARVDPGTDHRPLG